MILGALPVVVSCSVDNSLDVAEFHYLIDSFQRAYSVVRGFGESGTSINSIIMDFGLCDNESRGCGPVLDP